MRVSGQEQSDLGKESGEEALETMPHMLVLAGYCDMHGDPCVTESRITNPLMNGHFYFRGTLVVT